VNIARYALARINEPSTWIAGAIAAVHSGLIPPGHFADFLVLFLSASLAAAPDGLGAILADHATRAK
jgi:hypothetical protein